MFNSQLDLSDYKPVNFLWNEFAIKFGKEKADSLVHDFLFEYGV